MHGRWYGLRDVVGGSVILRTAPMAGSSILLGWAYSGCATIGSISFRFDLLQVSGVGLIVLMQMPHHLFRCAFPSVWYCNDCAPVFRRPLYRHVQPTKP